MEAGVLPPFTGLVLGELFFVKTNKKFRQYFVYYRNFLRSMDGKKPHKTGLIPAYTALAFYFSVAMVISACLRRKICVACMTFSSSSCLFILSMASS